MQTLNVTWEKETEVFICLETSGEEYVAHIDIEPDIDDDEEVMRAVFCYLESVNIQKSDDCEVIFDGVAWEVV
jgi:hypothetical protein